MAIPTVLSMRWIRIFGVGVENRVLALGPEWSAVAESRVVAMRMWLECGKGKCLKDAKAGLNKPFKHRLPLLRSANGES